MTGMQMAVVLHPQQGGLKGGLQTFFELFGSHGFLGSQATGDGSAGERSG
jgi:hypothetical protein